MWTKTYSKLYTNITKEEVWNAWTDVNNWHKWHDDLDYCDLEGPFKVGNHFMLKPKQMSPIKITITEVKEYSEFTDCTRFWGAQMYDTHTLEETDDGIVLTNKLVVTGWLRSLWIRLVINNIADTVPGELDALARYIQEQRKKS